MKLMLLQITSPYFCAGAKVRDQTIIQAAPIIRYMERWNVDKTMQYAKSKGWRAVLLLAVLALGGCAMREEFMSSNLAVILGSLGAAVMISGASAISQPPTKARIIFFLFCGLFVLAACAPAAQAAPLDLVATRDAVCLKESRASRIPSVATGDSGESRGECQISVDTAIWMIPWAVRRKFVPAYMLMMLKDRGALTFIIHYPPVNRGLALAYLTRMYESGKRTAARLAYGFNAGHNSRFGSRAAGMAYAHEIVILLIGPPPVPQGKRLAWATNTKEIR